MKKVLFLLALGSMSFAGFATTYYNKAAGTADLETLSNWGTGTDGTGTPPPNFTTSGNVFDLYNGTTATIGAAWVITGGTLNIGNGTAAMDLTIPASFSLTGTGTVNVKANSTLTIQNATNPTLGTLDATSTVDYNGTGAQTIAAATYGNLSLSGARTGTPAITLPSGTISMVGDFLTTYTGSVTFIVTGNTFNYSSTTGNSTVAGITYNILTLSNTSGTNTAGGNITVNSTLTTTAGGTLDMGSTSILSVASTITNGGTIQTEVPTSVSATPIPAGYSLKGTIIYGAINGGQTVVSETYYTNLTLNNTSGTNTAAANITMKSGTLTTTAGGTLDLTASYRLLSSGGGGGATFTNNGAIETEVPTSLSPTPIPSGKTWGGTGAIIYNASAGGQTIVKGTYNCGLTSNNTSGTNTAGGVLTVNGTLTTVSGGTLAMSTYALAGTGGVSNDGIINTASITNPALPAGNDWTGAMGYVIFSKAAGGQYIPNGTYGTLKFSNTSGTNTAEGAITVNDLLITTSGGILGMGTYQLLSGGFALTNNGSISTSCTANPAIPAGLNWGGTTGSVNFVVAAGGQHLPGGTYQKLTMSNSSGADTAVGNIVINSGTLTTTSGGILFMGTANILSGSGATYTNSGKIETLVPTSTSATPIPSGLTWAGTIIYGATAGAQTVVGGTYASLTLSNTSGTNTAGGNITANGGTFTTTAGGTLDMGTANILSGTSTFTNNGTITTSVPTSTSATPIPSGKAWAGTIIYGAAAGAQTIVSETSYVNLTLSNASGTNTSAGNLSVSGALRTTAGGTLDMGTATLSGTLSSITGGGTIMTANTTASPIKASVTWPQLIEYYHSTGGQTIVSGTYNAGLTNNNTSGTNTVVASGTVSITGNLTLAAGSTLSDNGVSISLNGNIAGTGTHTGTGKISMTASGATISGVTLGNLTLNNSGGFSTTDDIVINGTLTFTSGRLDIGANALTFGSAAPAVSGTLSSANMIIANGGGQVQKNYSATGTFLFPIGDNTPNYTPFTLDITAGTFAGGANAVVNLTTTEHPDNANTTNYLNRYWSLSTSGITSPVYTVSATYVPADVTGTEASMSMGQYPGTLPWIKYGATNTSTHTLSATGVSATASDFTGITTAAPTVTVTPTSATVCNGGTVNMSVSGGGNPSLSYSWAPSTGLSATTGTSVTATPANTGTVAVTSVYTVTISDGNGITSYATCTITVNPTPAINGIMSACMGSTTPLTDVVSGTWNSNNVLVASVNPSTGVVTGIALGSATITFTSTPGCTVTTSVSVNMTPTGITGLSNICQSTPTTLSDAVAGGTWSSGNTGVATVDATGIVTGVATGTATISYISGASCNVTHTVTVAPVPAISGTFIACVGLTTSLSDAATGGTWSSSSTGTATVGTTGTVTGVATGTVTISYDLGTGCFATMPVTINGVPAAITGTAYLCVYQSTQLSETVASGTWSSSNVAVASVGSTGLVTAVGITTGTAAISYISGPGCFVTDIITANPLPANISGSTTVCRTFSTTLTDAVTGGAWASSNGNVTIGSSSGTVTGVSTGTSNITYTMASGCTATTTTTVNNLPSVITGTGVVCAGLSTTLSDVTTGGTWSSGNTSAATVGSGTGVVTGVAAGTSAITYTSTIGCIVTSVASVNPLPASISGVSSVCTGLTTPLSDATTSGTWSSSNGNATIGTSSGTVTGVTAGTAIITYTLPTGCINSTTATVNALPTTISGTAYACAGQTTTLSDAIASGTWASGHTATATVGSATGIVTGVASGSVSITYTLPTGCINTISVTVNPLPASISGTTSICNGNSETMSDATTGGTWSSSDITNATVGTSSGIIGTVSSGPAIITYRLATGCIATTTLTVNDIPSPINGNTEVCSGSGTTTLTDPDGGGTWSSSNTAFATIGSGTGVVTPIAVGSSTITYTFTANGCFNVAGFIVDQLSSITGISTVCIGFVTTLSDATNGGDWASSNTAAGTIDNSGDVTGSAAGTTTISYSSAGGCVVTDVVTVNAVPSSTGPGSTSPICVGGTVTLNANSSNAAIWAWTGADGSTSTLQNPAMTPTATTTYSLTLSATGVGCNPSTVYTTTVTVNAVPTSTGATNNGPLCLGNAATLNANSTGATSWSWTGPNSFSSALQNPTVTPTVTGVYSLTISSSGSGCNQATLYTTSVTVNTTPIISAGQNTAIYSGGASAALTASGATAYSWLPVASLSAATGASVTATPTVTTTYTVTETNTGCNATAKVMVKVNPLPTLTGSITCTNSMLTVISSAEPLQIIWQLGGVGTNTVSPTMAAAAITVAGTGTGGSGATQLSYPAGVFVDASGNIYIADGNNRVQKWVSGATTGTTVAGTGASGSGATQLNNPRNVYVDASGNVYVTDAGNYRVQKWAPGATAGITVAGNGTSGSGASQLNNPYGVCVDASGNVYVGDAGNVRVQKWAPGATSGTTVAGTTGTPGGGANTFTNPDGICLDNSGNLYVADANNARVQEWAPGATTGTTVAGGVAGSGATQLNYPTGVSVDAIGNIYVADLVNNRVQKWVPGATTGTTVAGTGTAGSGATQLNTAYSVFVDGSGNVFAADAVNNRIQEFTASITTTVSVIAAGNYTALVSTNAGSVVTNTVAQNITPTSTGATNTSPVCSGTSVTLNSNSTIANSWSWTGPSGFSSSLQNPAITPTVTGVYSLTLTNTTAGCSPGTVYTTTVTINGLPSSSGITNTSTICKGSSVTLNSNSSNATAWSWNGSDGSISALRNPVMAPTATTTYSLTVSSVGTGCNPGTVYTTSVTVNTVPVTTLTYPGYGQYLSVYPGGAGTTLTASGATTYSWLPVAGLSATTGTSVTATPTVTTTYTVTGTNTTCSSNAQAMITVIPTPTLSGSTCQGSILTLSSSTQPFQIIWQFGGVGTSTVTPVVAAAATTVAGGNGAGSGATQLNYQQGVFVDANGNVYIADGNNRVQKWAHGAGSGTTVAGTGASGSGATQLNNPRCVYVDAGSNVYVTDAGNNRVQKWAPGATTGITVAGNGTSGSGASQLNNPYGIWVDGSGNVYVGDANNVRVQKWAPGATSGTTVAGTTGFSGGSANVFTNPDGMCIDNSGNIYIADANNARVQKWAPGATAGTTVAGGTAGSGAAQLNYPTGVSVDVAGNIYVADLNNNRIQKWVPGTTTGTTVAGTGTAGSGATQLNTPYSVYVDGSGNIFASDAGNNRIQEFAASITNTLTASSVGNYTGLVTTAAGSITTNTITTTTLPTSTGATSYGPICNGGTVALNSNSSNTTGWAWAGSDGSNSSVQNPVMSPTATTTYSLTISNSCGSSVTIYTTTVTVNSTPVAGPANNGPICNGGMVTLTANPSGGATVYSWAGSNLSSGTAQNPTATPTVTTTYSLTVTNGTAYSGCSPTTVYTTSVTVNAVPTSSGATNSGTICNGGTVTLNANSTGATAWLWTGSDASTSTVQNPAMTPTATTTYSLTISSIGSGCNPATVYTTSVTVNTAPSSTGATNSGSICNGGTVTLNANSAGATAWSWAGPNSFSSTIQNPTTTPTVTGVYSLTISSTGGNCSPATIYTTSVTVNVVPSSTGVTNSGTICNGGTVTLSANSTAATAWAWVGADGSSASAQNPAMTPTATTTYSLTISSTGSGCSPATIYTTSVTVNATPSSGGITNSGPICNGGTVTLNANSTGATSWSWTGPSSFSSASQNPVITPTVTGVYSLTISNTGTGCSPSTVYTTSVTVNAAPSSTGATNTSPICVGGTVTLNANSTGATAWLWTGPNSFSSALQNPTATPTVTGVYSLTVSSAGSSCSPATIYTTSVTINVAPSSTGVTNNGPVIIGGVVTLSDNSINATAWSWVGSDGFTSTLQSPTVTPAVTTTYSLTLSSTGSGCGTATAYTTMVTVISGINPITGTASLCAGSNTTLADATTGGTWASITTSVATVSTAGVVTGVSAGTSLVSYTAGGNSAAVIITVNPQPSSITGATNVCVGSSSNLADVTTGGIWSIGNALVATIGTGTGIVTGISSGITTVTYALTSTGCSIRANILSSPIAGPINGAAGLCAGLTISLSDTTAGGVWSISNPAIANVSLYTGVVTGIAAGTATVSYSLASGCQVSTIITVNPAPAGISGGTSVCAGSATALTDATSGGTWSISDVTIATIGTTGLVSGVSAGSAIITYLLPSGCKSAWTVSVDALPATVVVSSSGSYCDSTVISASNGSDGTIYFQGTTSGGTSTSTPSAAQAITSGGVYYFRALSASGCWGTEGSASVVINPSPSSISGTASVCAGNTTGLSDITTGGTWSSSNTSIVAVGSTGTVNGIAGGNVTVTYTTSTGCTATMAVTVNTASAITGAGAICAGATTTLNDATGGGTWSSSTTAAATIGSGSGTVTGLAAGTTTIVYTTVAGCTASKVLTVNPLPSAISGLSPVCIGSTITLADAATGGTWSSSNGGLATIDASSGIVTGIGTGNPVITYLLSTGCKTTSVATVNPLPVVITGTFNVCVGSTTALSDATAGGAWSSSDITLGTVGSTGIVTGIAAGSPVITYTLGTGCIRTVSVVVNPLSAVTGTTPVCSGFSITLSDAVSSGAWSSGNNGVAIIVAGTGIVTGVSAGTAAMTYSLPSGCKATTVVTVNTTPAAISGTASVCAGLTTSLSDATTGGAWASSDVTLATVGSTGIITGVAAGNPVISYSLGSGCQRTLIATVNALSTATGSVPVCAGLTINLSDATTGGTWSSSNNSVATIAAGSGVVTGVAQGTATMTYLLPGGCKSTAMVTVNALPSAIVGAGNVCVGSTLALTDATTGGTWSSSNAAIAAVGSTGQVSGIGSGIATITYTSSTGCSVMIPVTVNSVPSAITGTTVVCAGSVTALTDVAPGGAWSSSNGTYVTVDGSGNITGVAGGSATITYTMGAGCYAMANVTVNAILPISGMMSVCGGSTTTLADGTTGGTWSSSNISNATVGSSNGVVNGLTAGTTVTITYSLLSGCIRTANLAVNSAPSAVTGSPTVCIGATTTFSDATIGGTWSSSSPSIASVGLSTGIVTGSVPGTANIIYTAGSGCTASKVVSVNANPSSVSGASSACVNNTTLLTDATVGGAWSSSNTATGTIDGSGNLAGISMGATTVTYQLGTGCYSTRNITINPLPQPISGTAIVCAGSTTSLSDATSGSIGWSSSNTSAATVLNSGVVTGVGAGATNITYTVSSGCFITTAVTVEPLPSAVTGNSPVCAGSSVSLADATTGGTWSSSNAAIASIGSSTGSVSGVAGGTAIISYYGPNGCKIPATVTVNPVLAITGVLSACTGTTTSLSDATAGGTWASGNTGIATVGSSSGLVTGAGTGSASIVYTTAAGCTGSVMVTVNALSAITGQAWVCLSSTTTLSDAITGGTWSSNIPSVASIGAATGIVTGNVPGAATVTYLAGSGCSTTVVVTVNATPGTISGSATVCLDATQTLSDVTTGGTWSSSATSIETIDGSGNVAGVTTGTAVITYQLSTGCYKSHIVTVNPLPTAMLGTTTVCAGSVTMLSDATAGSIGWSSSNTSAATVNGGGAVTGVSAGTTTITYTISTGCWTTTGVTVNAIPATILGNAAICQGASLTLTDITTGGYWSSGNTSIASVGSATGTVSGVAGGNAVVSYTGINGCSNTAIATVNPISAISGNTPNCLGESISLSDAATGGAWSSSDPTIGSVGPVSGVVTPVGTGTVIVTYLMGSGCSATAVVTVSLAISGVTYPGASTICSGATTSLADATTGGSWSSGNTGIGTVDPVSGIVTGISGGTVTITYSIGVGCVAGALVTVNQSPSSVLGTAVVCSGITTALSDATPDGTWSSSNTGIASVSLNTGLVTGVSGGSATVSYIISNGCYNTVTVTANPLVSLISGTTIICIGATNMLSDATTGGTWSTSDNTIATVGTTGIVTGVAGGYATITYTLNTGCSSAFNIAVNPYAGIISGPSSVDVDSVITLSNPIGGGIWSSSNPSAGSVSGGVVSGLSGGTTVISYTVSNICGTATATQAMTVNAGPAAVVVSGGGAYCGSATLTAANSSDGIIYFEGTTSIGTSTVTPSSVQVVTVSGTYYFRAQSAAGVWGVEGSATVTINPVAAAVTGTSNTCPGLTTTLADANTGGTWSSSDVTTATVGSSSGIVTGVAQGTPTITYTLPTGCTATYGITVNPLPAGISGAKSVCVNSATSLGDASTGGVWSGSNSAAGTVGSVSGIVTGISAGTTVITYTLPTGCYATATGTVNPLPSAISGTATVCTGLTTSLSDASTGGTWGSSDVTTATIGSSSGIVTGVAHGTPTITYTLPTGCIATQAVTVNGTPSGITGAGSLCVSATTALSDAATGGAWSSSDNTIGSVIAGTGIVTGISAGSIVITYTLPSGCIAVSGETINALPATVTASGGGTYCGSTTITASNGGSGVIYFQGTTSGGTSTASASASQVVSASGTYYFRALSASGCWGTQGSVTISINPLPASVTGTLPVCAGSTSALADATTGGTWSSSDVTKATVVSATGVVTGIAAGATSISYSLPTGCTAMATVTVNGLPSAITGTQVACAGSTTALSSSTYGGTWSSGATGTATIGTSSGIVTGVSAGSTGITYTLGTGCIAMANVTVNGLPATVIASGTGTFCGSTTITASNGGDGTIYFEGATSGGTSMAIASASQVVSASGTYYFRAQSASGCWGTQGSITVSINPLPAAIAGANSICLGTTVVLSDATGGGVWSSSTGAVATIGTDGTITTVATGTTTIAYTLGTSCASSVVATVNPVPSGITGTTGICLGNSSSLNDAVTGGTWGSSNTYVATVGSGSGIVTSHVPGNATISYTLGTGCYAVALVTVNPLPTVIMGNTSICLGAMATLIDGTNGGNWSSDNTGVATIDGSGNVSSVSVGTANITYALAGGCITATTFTVNAVPSAISGAGYVCAGLTISLSDALAGGAWSSNPTGVASIGSTGIVTGMAAGTAIVTYTSGAGCTATYTVTVNQPALAITGNLLLCSGFTSALTDAGGGTWSSCNMAVATVGSGSGLVSGVAAGTANIIYTLPTGCSTNAIVSILQAPASITGTANMCAGSSATLTDAVTGGTWSSSNSTYAIVGSCGLVTGVNGGLATITYTMAAGCYVATQVTVGVIAAISGTLSACVGSTTTLADGSGGGNWSSSNTSIGCIGSSSGIVTGISTGTITVSYSLPSGCVRTISVLVNAVPAAISGTGTVCTGATSSLSDIITGGTWSSNLPSVASIVPATGIITGNVPGNATISYTAGAGCSVTLLVTVNTTPGTISGNAGVCLNATELLTDVTSGGAWSSSNVSVGSTDGIGDLTGVSTGSIMITYTLANSCYKTKVFTINPLPSALSGTAVVCPGSTTSLTDATTGAIGWCSSNTSAATVLNSGVVTGVAQGTATITYSISTGCSITMVVTVNPLPSAGTITGVMTEPIGNNVTLADAIAGGSWSSSKASVGTIGCTSGTITGIAAGATTISYKVTNSYGCTAFATAAFTVTASAPHGAGGSTGNPVTICVGSAVAMTDIEPGGTWSSSNSNIAVVGQVNGMVSGLSAGSAIISYTLVSGFGISITTTSLVVAPLPDAVIITANHGTNISDGEELTLMAAMDNSGTNPAYQWSVNGAPVPGATNAEYVSSSFSDNDTVACNVVSSGTCSGYTLSNSVVVRVGSLGISSNTVAATNIIVAPNPSKGAFTVSGTFGAADNEEVVLEVTDVLGQVVYKEKVNTGNGAINEHVSLSNTLVNGMYILNVKSGAENKTFHIVIEK